MQSQAVGDFSSSFSALYLCLRFFSMTFIGTAFGHPADGWFLDFEFSPGPSAITVGSQKEFFQGLSIYWVIFFSRKGFSDRSSTPAFFPTIPRWILLVNTTAKLSMSTRKTKSFGFALGVLRLSVLCLFSSAPHNFCLGKSQVLASPGGRQGFGSGLILWDFSHEHRGAPARGRKDRH